MSPCGNLNIIFSLNEFSLSKSLLVVLLNTELAVADLEGFLGFRQKPTDNLS